LHNIVQPIPANDELSCAQRRFATVRMKQHIRRRIRRAIDIIRPITARRFPGLLTCHTVSRFPEVIQMVIARGSIYLFALAALSAFAQTTCAQLTSLKLPGATITLAESVDAGPFRSPAAPAPRRFCRPTVALPPRGAWTTRGLQRCIVLFFMELSTCKVEVAGIAATANQLWMKQIGRNVTDAVEGILKGKRYLIHDREPLNHAHIHGRAV
jgi:hypothetical protein